MAKEINRRHFIYLSGVVSILMLLAGTLFFWNRRDRENMRKNSTSSIGANKNLGVAPDGKSYVYMAKNGSPEENTRKVIEMMGGIEKFIEPTDIVLLKPNAQWWNLRYIKILK